jgi:hypothetical protein
VDHVVGGRGDVQLDDAADRGAQLVDRDHAVRVLELPVELAAGHLDDQVGLAGARRGDVLDARQLHEDEDGDREQDQHGPDRPHRLQARRAVDLCPVGVPVAPPPAEPDQERDQQRLDEDEDGEDEDRDEPVALADALGVRRLRRDRRETAVSRECGNGESERGECRADGCEQLGAHERCHSTRVNDTARHRTRVQLPADVTRPFQVYVNGVLKQEGPDYVVRDGALVFEGELKRKASSG